MTPNEKAQAFMMAYDKADRERYIDPWSAVRNAAERVILSRGYVGMPFIQVNLFGQGRAATVAADLADDFVDMFGTEDRPIVGAGREASEFLSTALSFAADMALTGDL